MTDKEALALIESSSSGANRSDNDGTAAGADQEENVLTLDSSYSASGTDDPFANKMLSFQQQDSSGDTAGTGVLSKLKMEGRMVWKFKKCSVCSFSDDAFNGGQNNFVPVIVDRKTLSAMQPGEVIVSKWPSPLRHQVDEIIFFCHSDNTPDNERVLFFLVFP